MARTLEELIPRSRLTFMFGVGIPIAADYYCGYHDHAHFEIVYHAVGEGTTTTTDGFAGDFVPGSIVIYPPYVSHDQQNRGIGHDICVQFAVMEDVIPAELSKTVYLSQFARHPLVDELTALAESRRAHEGASSLISDFRVTAAVLNLVLEIVSCGSEPTANALADRADDYILRHYRTIESVGEIARHLAVSEGYLRHVYKAAYGMGLRQRLVLARVERAREMLTHTVLQVKEIATLCGFESEQYFATCFRRTTGRTAGSLRAEVRHGAHQ